MRDHASDDMGSRAVRESQQTGWENIYLTSERDILILGMSRSGSGLPIPGPKPHPFVGHTFQIPKIKTWKFFEKLAQEHGPIVRVTLAGDDIVVLSDPADAEELLGRRSRIYSSRRPLVYAGKYMSNNMRLTLLPYGDNLKRQRAAFHSMLQPRVIGGYEEMQYTASLRLLCDLVRKPEEFYLYFPRFPAGLIFTMSFGSRLADDGRDLAAVQKILMDFVIASNPGAHLVDSFPILDKLPDFLSPWRHQARAAHQEIIDLYGRLSRDVKARMVTEPELECFTARLWDNQVKMNLSDEELYFIAGSAFAAGTDTSSITLLWFVMAMGLYPETTKKAQEEIDAVFGSDTLPNFSRMQELRYTMALIKETIRWSPIAPLSFPHYLDAEDEYKGHILKKGTTVISSLWNMHHDEKEYPNSYSFIPERFLQKGPTEGDAADKLGEGIFGFGFGRRQCPGQHLAAKSTWIAVVRTLWAFNIVPKTDASGNPLKLDVNDCTNGLTSRPKPFPVDFVPRSAAHLETIRAEEARI
ncbi:cytochrome P450 [Mycena olivaceomarginata]|nr:cytochrome P450 [Mycena olivaceomarginata]